MDLADFLVHIGDGGEVDGFVFVVCVFAEVLVGDLLRRIDIPVGLVKMDKLNEGFVRVALFGYPTDGFAANDIGGETFSGAFVFAVAYPVGFVADLGVVV